MAFFEWVETLFFSQWVRESGSLMAFPMFLFSHTLGMSIVAGGSTFISFALLGLWPRGPIKPLERLYPVMWWGFGINLFTGVGLFCADATTRAVNLDFWIKLVFVAVGVFALTRMRKVFAMQTPLRRLAVPGDVASVVAMLVSPAGSFIHGADIPVSGGSAM